ncbi:hypothetical protein ACSNOH_13410 [Streptomyces sp. URMC 127]|uniref:hypothetical protein n=1 Tax=Streptomyces sp. URMC 127 TaxID=3423402 RepID=UPI003F1E2697
MRYRDPVLARTAALRHVREHVGRIEVATETGCRCKTENCAWHTPGHLPGPAPCSKTPVLVLIPDVLGRVWIIAEVCTACAGAIPRCKILRENAPAPPARLPVEDDLSWQELPAGCEACALGPASPAGGKQTLAEENQAPEETARGLGPAAPGWAPRATYAQYTESALAYLAATGAGRTAEARLLALLAALRMRKDGTAKLISEDLSLERSGLPDSALAELIADGWIDTTLAAVHSAVPGAPAAVCPLPGMAGNTLPAGVGKQVRRPYNGWVQRLVCHDALTGEPAGVRLTALYLTALSDLGGRGQVSRRHLAARCCLASPQASEPILQTLLARGWLDKLHPNTSWNRPASYRLATAMRSLVPGAAPTTARATRTPIDLTGRGQAVAEWARDYYLRHQHAPPLREVIAAHCQENPAAPWNASDLRDGIAPLVRERWLKVGTADWLPVRPSTNYWQAVYSPGPSRPRKRPALSPRQGPPQPARSQAPRPSQPDFRPSDKAPDLPMVPTRISVPHEPTSGSRPLVPEGLWLIPGAREVLGTNDR